MTDSDVSEALSSGVESDSFSFSASDFIYDVGLVAGTVGILADRTHSKIQRDDLVLVVSERYANAQGQFRDHAFPGSTSANGWTWLF